MDEGYPPVCDYEGSDYQQTFWESGDRAYEDLAEAAALRRLLPASGQRMLEVGAGAGRNTPRYSGYRQVVLLDYSRTQLEKAQQRLGTGDRYIYVVGDVYRLPFRPAVFDGATMIRTIHHLVEPQRALGQIHATLAPGSVFILEYANKRNLKAILRWGLRRQEWNPFTPEPVEFAALNFDFHPDAIDAWLTESGFTVERKITVSHFRIGLLKRTLPARWLASADAVMGRTGDLFQLTPSVFLRARKPGGPAAIAEGTIWRCPACFSEEVREEADQVVCGACGQAWRFQDGIYDFKTAR